MVYITFGGYQGGNVWKTVDGGAIGVISVCRYHKRRCVASPYTRCTALAARCVIHAGADLAQCNTDSPFRVDAYSLLTLGRGSG